MLTLFDHISLWGALFGFGFVFGFMITYVIVVSGKKRL